MKITDLFEDTSRKDFERITTSLYFKEQIAPFINEKYGLDDMVMHITQGALLYHGSQNSYPEGVIKFQYRGAPRDTVLYSHDMVNRLSEEKFGEPVRRLLFAMNSPTYIRKYSGENDHRVLFPLGQYRMFYHPRITDFTIDMSSSAERTRAPEHIRAVGSLFKTGIDAIPEFDFRKKDDSSKHFKEQYFFNAYQPVMRHIAEMLYEKGVVLDEDQIKTMLRDKLGGDVPQEDFDYMFKNMYRVYLESKRNMDIRLERYVDGLKEITGKVYDENIGHSEIMIKCDGFMFMNPEDIGDMIEYYIEKNSSLGLLDDQETEQ